MSHHGCRVYWGSHGCDKPLSHTGDHVCRDEDNGDVCEQVDRNGVDPTGFQWFLYGEDAPTEEGRGE